MTLCSTNVFTEDLEEAMVESTNVDEIYCCNNDSHDITELLQERLERKGIAIEHTIYQNDVGTLLLLQRNESGSLSRHSLCTFRTQ